MSEAERDREKERAAVDHGRVRRREYETIRVLGTGSKATVKLARRRDGAHVALKAIRKPGAKSGVPDPAADEFAAARREWLTEVRALELVGRHENMPALVEAFETGSKWYIAMEYQRGGDLFSRLAVLGQFTELHASAVIATIVNAVHFLHSHGIAHRDLKPANLLMKDESENSNLCLVDFGAGFVMDSKPALKSGNGAPEDTTRHASLHRQSMKTITGTPFYLAPEIVVGQPYSTKVDLWSVGCIAYQLLVGVTPFQSSPSFDQLYQRIVAAEYSFPEDIPLSDLAKDFVRSLLVPNPELRSSAGQAMRHPWIRQAVPPGYLLLLLEFNHEANPRLFAPPSLEVLDGDSLWGLVPTAAPDLHPRQPSDVEGSLGRSVKTRWEQQGRPGVLQVPTQGNELEPDPIDSEAQPPMSTPQHPDLYDPSNRPRTASEGYSYSPQFLFPAPEYQPQHPQYAQQYASPQPYGIFTPGHPNSWTPLYAHPESLGHLESGNLSQVELGDRLGGEEARDSPDSQTQAQGDELVRVRGLLQDLVGFGVGERRF